MTDFHWYIEEISIFQGKMILIWCKYVYCCSIPVWRFSYCYGLSFLSCWLLYFNNSILLYLVTCILGWKICGCGRDVSEARILVGESGKDGRESGGDGNRCLRVEEMWGGGGWKYDWRGGSEDRFHVMLEYVNKDGWGAKIWCKICKWGWKWCQGWRDLR